MQRFFPLMPQDYGVPARIVIDMTRDDDERVARWFSEHGIPYPETQESREHGVRWSSLAVKHDGRDGRMLVFQYDDGNSIRAKIIRTDLPGLVTALDDLLWNDMRSAPQNGHVVWVRSAKMDGPCLASFGQYRSAFSGLVSLQWTLDHDFVGDAREGTLVMPEQWRHGYGELERMPLAASVDYIDRVPFDPDGAA